MVAVDVFLSSTDTRKWHEVLIERLCNAGHDVQVIVEEGVDGRDLMLQSLLRLEHAFVGSTGLNFAAPVAAFKRAKSDRPCELAIDFSRYDRRQEVAGATLTVLFQDQKNLIAAAEVLCRGEAPVVDILLNGSPVMHAAPGVRSRVLIGRGLDDVLARAITLIVSFVDRYDPAITEGRALAAVRATKLKSRTAVKFATSYLSSALPRLVRRVIHDLRFRGGHWRVGYRFIDGPGVAETGSLAGTPWSILPDGGDRFYADPFPFEWQGRNFIFVEQLIHAQGKGVISVSECGSDGVFCEPRTVLEEPFHLSYPQVFERGGHIWMIPESAGGTKLSLYRAASFPYQWVEERVLIADREIFDATLLDYDDTYWLFATERDGAGDASDTMVVYFAERIEGPWQPHPKNPIVIDKAAARPGGSFVKVGDRIMLPIQDGTERYGGGLGLSQLIRLNREHVELSTPVPIDAVGDWPYSRIHTLNRNGRLETIDGLDLAAKRKLG